MRCTLQNIINSFTQTGNRMWTTGLTDFRQKRQQYKKAKNVQKKNMNQGEKYENIRGDKLDESS